MGEVRHAARKTLAAWSLTGSALVVLAAALVLLALNASRPTRARSALRPAVRRRPGLRRRRRPDRPPGPRQRDRLAARPSRPGPDRRHADRTVRPVRPGHGPRRGPGGQGRRRPVRCRSRADRDPAGRPGPAVPGRAAAVAALAAGPVGAGRRGGWIGRPAVPGRHQDHRRNHRRAGRAGNHPNPLGVLPRNGWFSGLLAGSSSLPLSPCCSCSPRCSCVAAAPAPNATSSWPGWVTSAC